MLIQPLHEWGSCLHAPCLRHLLGRKRKEEVVKGRRKADRIAQGGLQMMHEYESAFVLYMSVQAFLLYCPRYPEGEMQTRHETDRWVLQGERWYNEGCGGNSCPR